jgi:hypothetical protein
MADPPSSSFPQDDPMKLRRSSTSTGDAQDVTFAHKGLTAERLQALKEFLKHAKADEIAAVRGMYGEMPEVLRMIGLEVMPESEE